jgi:hypothetical protein
MPIFDSRTTKGTTDIEWSTPDSNLWVASANGDYAGLVEFVDGHFSVRGSTGSVVAECSSIPAAQAALARHIESPPSIAAAVLKTAVLNPASPGSFLCRTPRPAYWRDSLAA